MLISKPDGHYHFLRGIDPYSCGVVADPGWQIVHATLDRPLPWRDGFNRVEQHLQDMGRDRQALCAVELRCPAPFTMDGFIAFNQDYCKVIRSWDLYVDDLNPIARTNVAPAHDPPDESVLHAFSYTAAAPPAAVKTLVLAGAGELREGVLSAQGIIRAGDSNEAAMREKVGYVMGVMADRLLGLGGSWSLVNAVNVYTVHAVVGLCKDLLLSRMGPAARHGVRWHDTRPPVIDIEFEMDMRAVRSDLWLSPDS